MGSNNKQNDEKIPVKTASRVTFCQRKKSEKGNGSFVSNLRNHFHEFIHASAEEHKTCLRNTIQKIINASKFLEKTVTAQMKVKILYPFSHLQGTRRLS